MYFIFYIVPSLPWKVPYCRADAVALLKYLNRVVILPCLVPTRLSVDENVRTKEGGNASRSPLLCQKTKRLRLNPARLRVMRAPSVKVKCLLMSERLPCSWIGFGKPASKKPEPTLPAANSDFIFRANCVIIKNSFSQNNSSAPKAKILVRSDPSGSPIRSKLSDPGFIDRPVFLVASP